MQTRRAVKLAAEQAATAASASAHAVLFSQDLWLVLWPSLDAPAKAALRGVCSAMRRQVDGSIEVVASPRSGFSAAGLTGAMRRWPRVIHLTLHLGVGDAASTLQPLATAMLTRLQSLTVREVRHMRRACTACMHAWLVCRRPGTLPAP
jgi:hypothetical protein